MTIPRDGRSPSEADIRPILQAVAHLLSKLSTWGNVFALLFGICMQDQREMTVCWRFFAYGGDNKKGEMRVAATACRNAPAIGRATDAGV